jgi:2-haloacid dehalogenase
MLRSSSPRAANRPEPFVCEKAAWLPRAAFAARAIGWRAIAFNAPIGKAGLRSAGHGEARMQLSQFKALSFDCYGTLIDWETGLLRALELLREQAGIDPEDLLIAHGLIEHEIEEAFPSLPYSKLLEKVHGRLSERLGLAPDDGQAVAFGASVGDWPAFPDSSEALAYLKGHFQLIILSNVDRKSFVGSNRRLGVEFDQILTAEEIGSYKHDLRNFEYLLTRVGEAGIAKHELLHTAQSLFHDHVPANSMGIASAWIDRRHGKPGGATVKPDPMPHYDFRFTSLGDLAAAHRAEQG